MLGGRGPQYNLLPEVMCSQEYGAPVDVYSFGVLLFELLAGTMPYGEERLARGRARKKRPT